LYISKCSTRETDSRTSKLSTSRTRDLLAAMKKYFPYSHSRRVCCALRHTLIIPRGRWMARRGLKDTNTNVDDSVEPSTIFGRPWNRYLITRTSIVPPPLRWREKNRFFDGLTRIDGPSSIIERSKARRRVVRPEQRFSMADENYALRVFSFVVREQFSPVAAPFISNACYAVVYTIRYVENVQKINRDVSVVERAEEKLPPIANKYNR